MKLRHDGAHGPRSLFWPTASVLIVAGMGACESSSASNEGGGTGGTGATSGVGGSGEAGSTGAGNEGGIGPGTGGSSTGGTGNAGTGGEDGGEAGGGAGGSGGERECIPGDQQTCAKLDPSLLGECRNGTIACTPEGEWGPCSIQPRERDACSESGNDATCDGTPNGGCPCIDGETQPCGPPTEEGACTFGVSRCVDESWGECKEAVLPAAELCNDDGIDENCDGSVNEGCTCLNRAVRCDELQPQLCTSSGTWQNDGAACEHLCVNAAGTCTGVCTPDAVRCQGTQPQKCTGTGAWQNTGVPCEYVCVSSTAQCTGVCTPDAVRCNGAQPQACTSSGAWQDTGAACDAVACQNGACAGWRSTIAPNRAYVSVDASGNARVAGFTTGTLPGQTRFGATDAFARQYGPTGAAQWSRQFGTSDNDYGLGVSGDANGNVYVVGETTGTLPGLTSAGVHDVFLRRLGSATGVELWSVQFGTSGNDTGAGVAVDGNGDVYIVGYTPGTLPGQANAGNYDAFVRKYDASGTELWTRQFGTSGTDYGNGVAVDGSGNVYVAGETPGTLPAQSSAGSYDAFVRKYSSSGAELWTRQFGTSGSDGCHGVAADGNGNVYVAGAVAGALSGQTSAGGADAFVRKYDSSGTEVWTKQFGTTGNETPWAMTLDTAGNAYVAGWTSAAFPGHRNAGSDDGFVRKYDPSGEELWTKQFGTSSNDGAFSVSVDGGGNLYLAGELGGQAFVSKGLP